MGRRRSQEPDRDLFRSVPHQTVESEVDEQGKVVLLRPRFLRGPLAWWLQPRLRRPHFRVHLDELGSFVWGRCDGQHTVDQIVEALEQAYSDRADQARERVQMFVVELYRGKMLRLVLPPPQPPPSTR